MQANLSQSDRRRLASCLHIRSNRVPKNVESVAQLHELVPKPQQVITDHDENLEKSL
jgi:hypothetical protein